MYKGKYSRERRRRPALWAALALALVLTLTAGGTVAYLFTNTDAVTNTFTPASTGIEVPEEFDKNAKTSIKVKNTGDIPVYVRVMLVASYQNDAGEVCGTHTPNHTINYDTTNWILIGDYYYYKKPVAANNGETENLLAANISMDTDQDGCKEHIDVLAQAIQAEPTDAVINSWKVTLDQNGHITGAAENQ